MILMLSVSCHTYATIASPVVQNYGDVFPSLYDVVLGANRTNADAPWFVKFNLLTSADIAMGVKGNTNELASSFHVTSIRLVEFSNSSNIIAFGSNVFPSNPFPSPIDQLVLAPNLKAGTYALAVSGSGDNPFSVDFFTHLNVLHSVPLPSSVWLLGSSLLGLIGIAKRKTV